MEDTKDGVGLPLYSVDGLEDMLEDFNAYEYISTMGGGDLDDLEAIRIIFSQSKKRRSTKCMHDRLDWDGHVKMLLATKAFENCFHTAKESF